MRSSTGETAWHGPHHSAQKSTMTLPSEFRTSVSNVSVVALVAIGSFQRGLTRSSNAQAGLIVPVATVRSPVFTRLADKPDHPALELEMLDLWERERNVRAAARAQPRRPALVVRRRPRDREQDPLGVHTAWGGRSRTSSSATRRCAASTSATRTASTARASGSRSASSASSGSTRSPRSRSTASRRSRGAAATSSSGRRRR